MLQVQFGFNLILIGRYFVIDSNMHGKCMRLISAINRLRSFFAAAVVETVFEASATI